MKVVMQENANLSRRPHQITHSHFAQQDVGLEIVGIAKVQLDADRIVTQDRVPHQRAILIGDLTLPGLIDPVGLPVDRNAEPERVTFGMVLDADVREVNVADPVVLVEIQEEVPVAEHQRAGHWALPPQGYSPPNASSKSNTFSKSVNMSSSCLIRIP